MKKHIFLFIITAIVLFTLTACHATCDKCGKSIEEKGIKANGRIYCDYSCYMNDFFGF